MTARKSSSEPPTSRQRKRPSAARPDPSRRSSAAQPESSLQSDESAGSGSGSGPDDGIEPELLEGEVLDAGYGDEPLATAQPDAADDPGDDASESVAHGRAPIPVGADGGALVPSSSLDRYLAELRTYPILSREQELEVIDRYYVQGDAEAAVKLVTSNLRLVVMVAREYQRAFHNLLDLIQEGNIGLLEAVKQFDPYRGVRFPSYAVWWIRAYVIRYVMNNFRLVKVGTTQAQRRLFFNLRKEKARLEALGFAPTPQRIAEALGVKEKEVIEMDQRLATSSEVSVETPLGYDSGAGTMLDLLPAPGESAEDEVAGGEFYALMKEKLDDFALTLRGREAEIFRERLMAETPLTLQELGDRYGVSRERVRQMESAVKKRLREYLVSQVRDLHEDMVD
ncbi:MAG: RNA polymerase factor sigma-32 [Deltaproteobacteria bacterium]|nr:RNA polymerase factor sigma-32 [Deltaproteobacteria bacterium]